MRRFVSLVLALVLSLGAALAGASPAAAAPATGKVKVDDWPSNLRWALPNTEEFYGRYMSKEAGQPCSKEDGGNAYRYVMDYLDHTGEVFQMISHTTGTPVLAITDIGGARTDLPQLSTVDVPMKDGSKLPPTALPFVLDDPQMATGKALCGNDFAQFGVSDLQAPFGFSFYSEPDASSIKFIESTVQSFGPAYAAYWAKRYPSGFDARNLDSYCAQDNPFCLTASFLHCDQRAGDTPDPSAVSWCKTWNYRVAMFNARLMELVRLYGTNEFDDQGALVGPLKPIDIASNAVRATPDPLGAPTTDLATIGRDGYLARWAAAIALPDYISFLRGFGKALTIGTAVGLGAAAGIAAFWLGAGLLGSLLIGGAVTAFTVFSGECGLSELSKCLAKMTAEGMSYTLASVPDAAAATKLPSMTSSIWKSTFNDIATVSVAMLLVLFIINLIMSLVAGKPQLVFRSFLGVFGYFVALSAGGALLSLLVAARNLATQKISGGPGFINELTNTLIDAINKLGSDQTFTGWLLIAVLCLISMISGFIVLCILYLSNAWVPLIVAILILQLAGWAAPGLSASKWFRRGTGILWSTLLMAPGIALLWRVGMSMMTNTTEVATIAIGTATLLASAAVPGIVAGLFSLGAGGKLGLGAATLGAGLAAMGMGKAVAGLAGGGASMRPGKEPGQMTDDQLAYGSRLDGRGSGALSSIASKITPTTSSSGAASASGSGSDPWAVGKDDAGNRGKHSAGDGRSKISAVSDSAGATRGSSAAASGAAGELVSADRAADASSAAAAGAASAVGGVIGLNKTSASERSASGSGAGPSGGTEDMLSRSEGSGPSAGSVPPRDSVHGSDSRDSAVSERTPDAEGSVGQGAAGAAAPTSLPAAGGTTGGPATTGAPGSPADSSATGNGSSTTQGQRPGGADRAGLRSIPSATPPAGTPPDTPGTAPGSRSGMHTQGWGARGAVPSGSMPGGTSPGAEPSQGSSTPGSPPAGWPTGVPWGVPLEGSSGETADPRPSNEPAPAPWHAHDLPWGEPPPTPGNSTPDEDPRTDGSGSS